MTYTSISDRRNHDYHRKFGSLFAEFKNNKGFWSTQYYSVFFIRRISYLLSQVYLNSVPSIQISVNIGFSVLQLGYLFYYFPFKENYIMFSVVSGEISTTIFLCLSAFFVAGISENTSAIIEMLMVYTVIGGMGMQFLVSIYSMALSLKAMWKKVLKYRALAFLKAAPAGPTLSHQSFRIE